MSTDDFRPDSDVLRAFLAETDAPCPLCRYNLRGLTGEHCPECGHKLTLRVSLASPRNGLYIFGLVGLAAGAGFSTLLLAYFFYIAVLKNVDHSIVRVALAVNGTGAVVEGAALGLWIVFGRRYRLGTTGKRAMLALAAWLLTLINLIIFSMYIR